eukprot:365543-Chlamydomonas_euryale.AAC.2
MGTRTFVHTNPHFSNGNKRTCFGNPSIGRLQSSQRPLVHQLSACCEHIMVGEHGAWGASNHSLLTTWPLSAVHGQYSSVLLAVRGIPRVVYRKKWQQRYTSWRFSCLCVLPARLLTHCAPCPPTDSLTVSPDRPPAHPLEARLGVRQEGLHVGACHVHDAAAWLQCHRKQQVVKVAERGQRGVA